MEDKLKQLHADTVKLCQDLLASSPNPEAAVKTPEQLADERVAQVREALANGFDCGGIAKDIVKVDDIRNEPYVGWVYVTINGLYSISFR